MIVPAAGRGSRLGSTLPKVLVPVNGRPMIDLVLDRYAGLVERFIIVVAPAAVDLLERHRAARREAISLAVQSEPTGMLDAILEPAPEVIQHGPDEVWITWCDQVAIRAGTVARLAQALSTTARPAFAFPTVRVEAPYIHFDRDPGGRIIKVRQRREGVPMPPTGEADVGLFAMPVATYREHLPRFAQDCEPGSGTRERNFLPFIPWLASRATVVSVPAEDPLEAIGINTPDELIRIASALRGSGAFR